LTDADYIVVGSGLTGAVIARQLTDAGREVLVLEKRPVIGGNCYDEVHPESGIRFNLHGPHYFRTSSEEVWEYAQRFAEFRKFEAVIKACVGGKIYDYPITQDYMDGARLNNGLFDGNPKNFEEVCLSRMPEEIYRKFIKGYTEKQWGKRAADMDASLASRVEVRQGKDRRLSTKKYQGVPANGYTDWIARMLSGIEVRTGVDWLVGHRDYTAHQRVIYTGAIDAYFRFSLGRLEYRSQSRMHSYFPESEWILPACQVNYPHPDIKIIREIEWKHIWPTGKPGTLITQETPIRGGEEYPVPDRKNGELYRKYREMAGALDGVLIEGRLGRFVYRDMDEALANGLMISKRILND